jgi:3-oxoacyl-[acyl-carrier-protein] synthase II
VLFPLACQDNGSHRVAITGAGIITSLGAGWSRNAEGFRVGQTAFRQVTLFDVSRQRVKRAAEVDLPSELPHTKLNHRSAQRTDRAAKLLLHAAHEAWEQSGWQPDDNIPIVLGTTGGGMTLGERIYRQAIRVPSSRRGQATRVVHYQPQRQAMDLAEAFGFGGPITIIANACASGANAIGHAWELLRRGHAQRVLAGGYEGLSQLIFAGFDSLQALSPTECRPFDTHRDGLALGEGAAVLTLETLEHASRRQANILAEIVGYGAVTDGHHLTQPHPQGDAALASMKAACESAGLSPEQIGYVNAHGTGTLLNDSAEATALNRWAGPRAKTLPVSSTKASIGHLLGAAGAVEVVICLMALKGRWLPPTATLRTPEASCEFPILRKPLETKVEYVLSNSFGFGGANASLILRRWS